MLVLLQRGCPRGGKPGADRLSTGPREGHGPHVQERHALSCLGRPCPRPAPGPASLPVLETGSICQQQPFTSQEEVHAGPPNRVRPHLASLAATSSPHKQPIAHVTREVGWVLCLPQLPCPPMVILGHLKTLMAVDTPVTLSCICLSLTCPSLALKLGCFVSKAGSFLMAFCLF